MAIRIRVGRWLSHTRFVPTPLYRLALVAAVISGLLQLVYGAPAAVSAQAQAGWFDWTFVGLQLVGAICALWGLYLVEGEQFPWAAASANPSAPHELDPEKLQRSLTLELFGLILLQTVMAIQIAATTFDYGRPPSSLALWIVIVFWVWSFFRDRDIIRAVRKLARP